MEPSKKPLNVLIRQMNAHVGVILKNNTEFRGIMVHCDSYMNIILNGASEHCDRQVVANYGRVLVRGNNILYIVLTPPQRKETA